MKNYYHSCFTCPQCHEPHKGSPADLIQLTLLENGNLICSVCGTEFRQMVRLPQNLPCINRYRPHTGLPVSDIDTANFPLHWNVVPNVIEKEYIEWVLEKPGGNFLITWPWKEIRFIPILLTEICAYTEDAKIVVIGGYEEIPYEREFFSCYSLPEIIEKTICIDEILSIPEDLKRELEKLKTNRSLLFELKNVVSVRCRKYGSGELKNWNCQDTLRKCINKIKKSSLENFGNSFLRNIITKKRNGEKSFGYNSDDQKKKIVDPQNGIWDVTLTEQEQWSGKLNYNIIWSCEVLSSHEKIIRCKDILKPVCYFSTDGNSHNSSAKVHLISSKSDPDKIFALVNKISPNIVIIENTDDFISDIRYRGPFSRELLNYLKNPAPSVLLFSTDPEKRQFYNLESEKNAFYPLPMTFHTLDSAQVLTQLPENSPESRFPNPLSSEMKLIIDRKSKQIPAKYVESEVLTEFYRTISSLLPCIDQKFANDINFFLRRVVSSPLNIIGDYSDLRYLTVRKGFRGPNISYDLIYSDLVEQAESGKIMNDVPESFRSSFHSQYQPEPSQNKNPLRDEFFRVARNILEQNSSACVTFVVNNLDIKGLGQFIAEDQNMGESLKSRLLVSDWRNLNEYERSLDKTIAHYVISSQYPSLSYNLRNSTTNEFIFIGDKSGIEKIQEIIDHRLLERFSFPIVKPMEGWNLPEFLKTTLNNVDLTDKKRIDEIYSDFDDEIFRSSALARSLGEDDKEKELPEYPLMSGIEIGEEVLMCMDRLDRALFIPIGKSVMIKKGDLFEDIQIDDKLPDAKIEKYLNNQEIILGKTGLFLSFRGIFFRFMMEHGNRMIFHKRPYSWTGYEELFTDSVLWIQLIEKAIEEYARKNSEDRKKAELFIATQLSQTKITANEIGTITGWLKHDKIIVNSNYYNLYHTEHPFRLEDIRIIAYTLKDFLPAVYEETFDPDRVYAASLCIQDLRRKVFKSSSDTDQLFSQVRSGLKKEINNILLNTEIFIPNMVKRVKVTRQVQPMISIQNYQDYL